jgi:predicted Zn finger-like uncharacterized protein
MTIIATRCPACGTIFEMKPEQLALADGWVRCGRCSEIFDGVASRCDIPGGEAAVVAADTSVAAASAAKSAAAVDLDTDPTDDAPMSSLPPRQGDPWSDMPSLDFGLAAPPQPPASSSVANSPVADEDRRPGEVRESPPSLRPDSTSARAKPAAAEPEAGIVPGALFRESTAAEPSAAPAGRRGWSRGVRLALVLVAVAILAVLAARLMHGR